MQKYSELLELLKIFSPCCACLQEIHIGEKAFNPPKGYSAFTSRSLNRLGSAIIVSNSVPFMFHSLRTGMQAVAVRIFLDRMYTVCSVYIPPSEPVEKTELMDLVDQLPRPFLLMGDFNSRHPLWGDCCSTFLAGTIISTMSDCDIECINDGSYTHYHIQTDTFSSIDLALCSSDAMLDFSFEVLGRDEILPFSSDHYPILLTLKRGESLPSLPPCWNIKKADWDRYTSLTEILVLPDNFPEIEEALNFIREQIVSAASISIPLSHGRPHKISTPWWSSECAWAVHNKQRASRRFQRSHLQVDKIEFKRLCAIARKTIRHARLSSWKKYVSSLNSSTPLAAMWNKIRKMKNKYSSPRFPVLNREGVLIADPMEVASMIAETFAKVSSGTEYSSRFKTLKRLRENIRLDFTSITEFEYNTAFTTAEYCTALARCRNTSPGVDSIHYEMLRHMHPSSTVFMIALFNRIWEQGYMPASWHESIIIPILKPSRDGSDPSNYRPISLTSCLCKLMERMVTARLTWYLEQNNALNPVQFDFRHMRSTCDPIMRLEHDIHAAFEEKKYLYSIFFDIEKAYDTTWRRGILDKLFQLGLRGSLPVFISNFFKNRTFRVRIGDHYSDPHLQQEGIPQGSVIGVTCFLLAINDITSVLPSHISATLYADDLAIYSSAKRIPLLVRRLQLAVNKIAFWGEMNGFLFSSSKTVSILFNNKRKKVIPDNVDLYRRPIPLVPHTKFLGVIFDAKLIWIPHLKAIKMSCQQSLSLLKYLSHCTWGADRSTLQILFQALVQSKLNYGLLAYSSATANRLKMIEPIRNQGLRLITGAFRSSPSESLHAECNVIPLRYIFDLQCASYYKKSEESSSCIAELMRFPDLQVENWNLKLRAKRVLDLITELDTIQIMPSKWQECPPWRISNTNICLPPLNISKVNCPTKLIKAQFLAHFDTHTNSIRIFTDGSKQDEGVGSAVAIPDLNLSDQRSLNTLASIFTAELYDILMALKIIRMLPQTNFVIFSDSKSVIFATQKITSFHPLVKEIQMWLYKISSIYKKSVIFCWVPAHVGIQGNELVDKLAKAAVLHPNKMNTIPYSDIKPSLVRCVRRQWQVDWHSQINNKLLKIKPHLEVWQSAYHKKRAIEVILCRIRIGHTRFTHGHLMSKDEAPMCERCQSILSIRHIFAECPLIEHIRQRCFPTLGNVPNDQRLTKILGGGTNFNLLSILKFLRETNILHKI
jgi:ribonuclease HI